MTQNVTTVAKQLFQDFKTDQVVDHTYNKMQKKDEALKRALRVFWVSYAEYERLSPQLYQQKFTEYLKAMQELYDVQNFDQNIIQSEIKSLGKRQINVTVGVKGFRGRKLVLNPRVTIINSPNSYANKTYPLNTDQVLQTKIFQTETILVDELKKYRRERSDVIIILEADKWKMGWTQLKQFSIGFDQIPVEGFEDWFYFGRGVRLLIKIRLRMVNTDKNEKTKASKFHLHSIIYMLRKRLQDFRNRPNLGPIHRPFGRKYKVTYISKSREPNEPQVFWWPPMTTENLMTNIQSLVDFNEDQYSRGIKTMLKNEVKFNDLQFGYRFYDDFNDSVCLCSEWCNWNAFFHYNPIYRFLLVQNTHLFLSSRTNIPEMYLFASTFSAYESGLNLKPNDVFPRTPVLRLMCCANDYRHLLSQTHYLTLDFFRTEYNSSFPDPRFLNGLTYNLLRNDIQIEELLFQTDVNPYSNLSIESVSNFYRLFSSLHLWCSTRTSLVDKDNNKKWFKELDQISRKRYRNYLKLGFSQRIAFKTISYDFLFTEDYEYSHFVCDPNIKSIRDNVTKKGLNDNPLNTVVICSDLLSTLMSVHKFIKIVEQSLPMATTFQSAADWFVSYKTLDTDFNTFSNTSEIDFKFDEKMIQQKNLEQIREVLTVFFTLKHYSIVSGLQMEFISSLNRVKRIIKTKTKPEQTSLEFNFIWRTTLLETKLRRDYPNLSLFELNSDIEPSFDEFYTNYWGRADHEINQTTQFPPNIASGFHEFQRLYFWWRNGGDNKFKFRRVIDSLGDGFEDIVNRSQLIYDNIILSSNRRICQTYDYHLEVTEVLVQYLMKSVCYMILSSIAVFLKKVHSLPIPLLVRRRISYSMSKPGWVPIFRTMRTAFRYIERLETLYIGFDDEFGRISTIFSKTKEMIRFVYRDFYRKLVADWVTEVNKLAELKNFYPDSEDFVVIHLAVGLSFLAAFIDDFRPQSRFYRKFLFSVLEFQSQDPHQMLLNDYVGICSQYLESPQQIRTAQPLLWTTWRQEMPSVDFNDWDQMDGQQLQIDLTAADS